MNVSVSCDWFITYQLFIRLQCMVMVKVGSLMRFFDRYNSKHFENLLQS